MIETRPASGDNAGASSLRARVLALPLATRWALFLGCWSASTLAGDYLLASLLLPHIR